MYKYFKMILSSVLMITVFLVFQVTAHGSSVMIGDTDADGEITILDATVIQKLIAELIKDTNGSIGKNGDIDGNGISILDATLIQRYLAGFKSIYPIGKSLESDNETETVVPTEKETQAPTSVAAAPVEINGKVTIGGIVIDVSGIPYAYIINNSSVVSKTFLLKPQSNIEPQDVTIQVNNGIYDYKTDYSDERFKENFLMKHY